VLPVLSFPAHKFPPICNSIATNRSPVTRELAHKVAAGLRFTNGFGRFGIRRPHNLATKFLPGKALSGVENVRLARRGGLELHPCTLATEERVGPGPERSSTHRVTSGWTRAVVRRPRRLAFPSEYGTFQ
jgi:hypothetical protein